MSLVTLSATGKLNVQTGSKTMRSQSIALIWEIWRRNRWGFVLLVVLLAAGVLFARRAVDLKAEVSRLEEQILTSVQSIKASQILPGGATGIVERTVQLRIDVGGLVLNRSGSLPSSANPSTSEEVNTLASKWSSRPASVYVPAYSTPVYEGPLSPADTISWSWVSGEAIRIRLLVRSRVIYDGPTSDGASLFWAVIGNTNRPVFDAESAPASSVEQGTNPTRFDLADAITSPVVFLERPNPKDSEEFAFAVSTAETWRNAGLTWSAVLMLFSVLAVFAAFGCAEPHAALGFTGIPSRRFTLPIRTRDLVMWPLLLGFVVLLVFYFGWSQLVVRHLLPEGYAMPDLYLSALLCAGLSVFQALVWGLPSFPRVRTWLVVTLVLGLLPIAGYALGMQSVAARDPSSEWNVVQMFLSGGFVCAWAAGIAAAFVGVGWERRGTWVGRRSLSEFMGSIDDPISRRFHFGSPFRALMWIEWRRNFRMPLLVWTLTIWISYSVVLTGTHFGLRIYVWDMIPVLATGFLFAGIAIIGLNTPRDAGSLRLSLSSFTATRPIDTETLVTAKLVAGAAAWGLAVSVLVISFGAALKMLGEFDQISSLDEAIMSQPGFLDQIPNLKEWIVVLAISLHLFVGILPLSASGKTPGFPWSIMPMILFYGGMMTLFEWAERDSSWHWDLCILLVGYVTLKLGVAFWAFRRSLERRLITQRFVAIYLVIWLSVTGLVVWAADGGVEYFSFNHSAWVLTFAGFAVFPLARIALLPLGMAMNRHR